MALCDSLKSMPDPPSPDFSSSTIIQEKCEFFNPFSSLEYRMEKKTENEEYNEKTTLARRHITRRRRIPRAKRISQIPGGIYITEKSTPKRAFFLVGYQGLEPRINRL